MEIIPNERLFQMASGGACEDSDSDMEDFRSVLEDSEMCLRKVDQSLKKKRSNTMGTGLASQGKYVSPHLLSLHVIEFIVEFVYCV
jgi:hypothetical protein